MIETLGEVPITFSKKAVEMAPSFILDGAQFNIRKTDWNT